MRSPLRALAVGFPVAMLLGWGLVRGPTVRSADDRLPPGGEKPRAVDPPAEGAPRAWTTAVTPKPPTENVRRGLGWLVEHQDRAGGWGQGEESAQMRGNSTSHDAADVADTCIAALALVRPGSTPREGPYKDAVARAVRFVRGQVEASDAQSLSVSNVQGTRVQMKLGPNIDTFLASLLLAEVKDQMADRAENETVEIALNKVLDKIKKNQKADGTWDNQRGWAPILAQSVGGKALNRARQNGVRVSDELLARTESFAKAQVERSAATITAMAGPPIGLAVEAAPAAIRAAAKPVEAGSAGVELYDRASSLGVLQDSVNTNATLERELRDKQENAPSDAAREDARKELRRIGDARRVHREAQMALVARLDDPQFVAGFGSNGGEEFLSYMNISESLVVKGGRDWTRWDDAMTSNLNRVQNGDGSWSGHHCITGRTFCTATALLVLMADRTPVPVTPEVESVEAEK